jgi:hypothetical protein
MIVEVLRAGDPNGSDGRSVSVIASTEEGIQLMFFKPQKYGCDLDFTVTLGDDEARRLAGVLLAAVQMLTAYDSEESP